jgi:hypothetical protein
MPNILNRILAVVLLEVLIVTPAAHASPPVTSGLVVSLDAQNGSSVSGTTWASQDGTAYNATLQSAGQYDSVNHLMVMKDNGTPSWANMGYGTSGDAINQAGDMTVEEWVRFDNIHTSTWNIFASKWFTDAVNGCSNPDWHFSLHLGKLDIYTTGVSDFGSTGATVTTGWHQVAWTIINPNNRSGSSSTTSGTLSLYLDGAQYITPLTSTSVYHTPNTACGLWLGDARASTAAGLGIDGALEKFRLYNRALSAAEINQNYRADASIRSLPAGPYNTAIPSITGPALATFNETATSGTWLNTPTSYSYQWYRSTTSNGTYSAISGATASTYVTTNSDIGYYLQVQVTATNSNGSFTGTSNASSQISAPNVTLGLTVSTLPAVYRTSNTLTATSSGVAGKITFSILGKAIPGCKNIPTNSGNSYTATCLWKPSFHAAVTILASFIPTNSNYSNATKIIGPLQVLIRSNKR